MNEHESPEQIAQDRSRYRALVQATQMGLVFCGLEAPPSPEAGAEPLMAAPIVEINAACLSMLGPQRASGVGAPLATLWPAGDAGFEGLLADFAEDRGRPISRRIARGPDRVALVALQFTEAPLGVWIAVADVTAQRRAEVRAQRAILELERSQAVARLGSYSWKVGTDEVRWSKELCRLMESEEASFETFLSRIHPDDRPGVLALAQAVLAGRSDQQACEYRLALPSGRTRWVRDVYDIKRDAQGAPLRMFGTSLDITARKEVELALEQALEASRASEARFQAAFDQAAVGIALLGTDGEIQRGNTRLAEMLGVEAGALRGRSLAQMFRAESQSEVEDAVAVLGANPGHGATLDLETDGSDGRRAWIRVSLALVRDAAQAPQGFMAVFEDRTPQREAEAQTAKLERQLLQAQKLEAVGQLAGGVAHDFNNILQIVQLNLDLLNIAPAAAETAHAAIAAAVERATMLVRQLLTFSRRDAHRPEPIDLRQVVRASVRMLESWLGARVCISVTVADEPVVVNADRGMIEQILLNLCVNARDAMPQGGPLRIDLQAVRYDAAFCAENPWARPGGYARLCVEDAGEGMSAEVRERIWEPFYTTKAPGKGTGLGLATVYGIVSRHDGLIGLQSTPGAGSCFSIHLPLASTASRRIPQPSSPPSAGDETLLVAEDDPALRQALERVLQGAGYTVLVAADGAEALALAEAHGEGIALAVLDVVMPGLGGLEVARGLSARSPRLPTLFSSGHGVDALIAAGDLPADVEIIRKPYNVEELLRRVRAILDG